MKRKFKRLLLSVFLAVFMCTCLAGCKELTDVNAVQVTTNDQIITVYSPEDNAFVLSIELKKNGETYSITSNKLYVSGNISQNYNLKDLSGGFIAEGCQIASINVCPAFVTSLIPTCMLVAFIALFIGALIGLVIGCLD